MRSLITPSLVFALIFPGAVLADAISLPHLFETSGSLAGMDGSLETVLELYQGPGRDCDDGNPADDIDLWLYNSDGTPLMGDGGPVCMPCSWSVSPTQSTQVSLTDLLVAAGVDPATDPDAFGVVQMGADGAGRSGVGGAVYVITPTGPELAGAVPPEPIAPSSPPEACKTFVFPHLLETRDLSASGGPTFDTSIFMTYLAGLQGGTGDPATETSVDLYLFDQTTGSPVTDALGNAVCAPCSYPMGMVAGAINPRKREINIESLITDGGGAVGDMEGLTVVLVASGNAQDVHMTAVTEKKGVGAFDLAVFVFEPNEIAVAARVSGVQEIARRYADLRNHPNPFNPTTTLSYTLPRAGDVTLRVTDVRGRVVRTLDVGRQNEGDHEVMWNGRDDSGRPLPSGTYLARLETADFATVQKMALLK